MYRLSNGIKKFDLEMTFRGGRSRSNTKKFEVKYLENGMR